MPEPAVRMHEDGKHIYWSHECNFADLTGSTYHADVMLPIHPTQGWIVEKTDPLTVSPSILCQSCKTHGFWREGKWVPA